MAYTKIKLSGSTDGKAILVAATATAGTTVHTAHATDTDYVTLYAVNTTTTAKKLTLEWGEATAPNGNIEVTIAPEDGAVQLTDMFPLTNSLVVAAFCETANVVTIYGHVTRVS